MEIFAIVIELVWIIFSCAAVYFFINQRATNREIVRLLELIRKEAEEAKVLAAAGTRDLARMRKYYEPDSSSSYTPRIAAEDEPMRDTIRLSE